MKSILLKILPFIALMLTINVVKAQEKTFVPSTGYKITVHINGNNDSMLLLGNYFHGDTYSIDSARRDKRGNFVFQNKAKALKPGLYFFSNRAGKYAEFVIYHEDLKKVVFTTNEENWSKFMKVTGSKQNIDFYEYQQKNIELYDRYGKPTHKQVDSIKNEFIQRHPDNMLSKMMDATRPVQIPTVNEKGDSLSQQERYTYLVNHYWDNMPLYDDFLARTPLKIFVQPVKDYLEHFTNGLMPAQLMPLLDSVLERAHPSKENFQYLVNKFTEYYLQSNIMVYDEIYVHMVKRYYESGDAFWASPSVVEKEVIRANKWDKILVGRIAPELILKDTIGNWHSLHRMNNELKVLVFWSPTCGHCKTTIPEINAKLKDLRKDYDIACFAVFTEPDDVTTPKWTRFINEHDLKDGWIHLNGAEANVDWRDVYDITSTPQIFLLDKSNKIIAKRLNAEILEMAVKAQKKTK